MKERRQCYWYGVRAVASESVILVNPLQGLNTTLQAL